MVNFGQRNNNWTCNKTKLHCEVSNIWIRYYEFQTVNLKLGEWWFSWRRSRGAYWASTTRCEFAKLSNFATQIWINYSHKDWQKPANRSNIVFLILSKLVFYSMWSVVWIHCVRIVWVNQSCNSQLFRLKILYKVGNIVQILRNQNYITKY